MSSVNKSIIVGRMGKDPEVFEFKNGDKVVNLSVATSERWIDKNTGEKKERTEWHTAVCNNRLAEISGQHLAKGSMVYIEGSLHTRKWQDQQGNDRYTTEVRVRELRMLDSKGNSQNQGYNQQQGGQQPRNYPQGMTASPTMQRQNTYQNGVANDEMPF